MDSERYRIEIDGEWSLADFHEFPYAYTQAYSFLYALIVDELQEDERLETTFSAYPWRGGYSAVNFFSYLYKLIPIRDRPQVISISYASPGWIELGLAVVVAISLKRIITNICDATLKINQTYTEIHRGLHERKLLSFDSKSKELELDREQLDFVERSNEVFAKLLGFENFPTLMKYSPNPLAALKMMFAFYRRVRKLKNYQDDDKLKF